MAVMTEEIYTMLSEQMKRGNVAAFLGAGVSRTYEDRRLGERHQGIKTASEMVREISRKKPYITPNMRFDQAFFLITEKEGDSEKERILKEYVDIPMLEPLPAHGYLAEMDFSSYLTTNYDTLMEKALAERKKAYEVVVKDSDVCRWQMKNFVPIVKLHGCIRQPETLIAAENEYKAIGDRGPMIASLLRILLANKTILFCGFSLSDIDFKLAYQELKDILGNSMPKSYAVIIRPENYERTYWMKQGVTLIESDLTLFLKGLYDVYCRNKYFDNSDWVKSTFMQTISKSKTSPTETQAINAFLEGLDRALKNPDRNFDDIMSCAKEEVIEIKKDKKMFDTMRVMWDDVECMLNGISASEADKAEHIIEEFIEKREQKSIKLSKMHRGIINRNQKILIYSQSVRVTELLKAVSHHIQSTCTLYICECRPKSSNAFQDALDISTYLKDTAYKKIIIPDVSAGNLMSRGMINMIIMGAHTLYFRNDEFTSFVNTCGTNILLDAARRYAIPAYVIAESAKIHNLDTAKMEDIIYDEEKDTFNTLAEEAATEILNIRYDLCQVTDNITLLSDI